MKNSFYKYFDCSTKEELYQKYKNNEVQELNKYFDYLLSRELIENISSSRKLKEFVNVNHVNDYELLAIMVDNKAQVRNFKNFDYNNCEPKNIIKEIYDPKGTRFALVANIPNVDIDAPDPFQRLYLLSNDLKKLGYSQLTLNIITGDKEIYSDYFDYLGVYEPKNIEKKFVVNESKDFLLNEEYRDFINYFSKQELQGLNLINDKELIRDTLIKSYGDLAQEQFEMITYDKNNNILDVYTPFIGSIDRSTVDLRILSSMLLDDNIKGFQVIHNHPSGDPNPSDKDIHLTHALEDLASVLNKELTEHYVVGRTIFSFQEDDLLKKQLEKGGNNLETNEKKVDFKKNQTENRDIFKENREQFVQEVIKSLEQNKIPWEQGWDNAFYNPTTGARYKGGNNIRLSFESFKNNYTDPRWVTFLQAKEQGWKIKKGAKSVRLEVFKYYDTSTKKDLDIDFITKLPEKEKQEYLRSNVKTFCKTFNVFNASQVEGMPPLEKLEKKVEYNKIDKIVKNCGVPVEYGGNQACYIPSEDKIYMPPKETFKNENSYYATMLHEIAHSTGHQSRLNRPIANTYGTKAYAYEELIAEFSSVFIGQEKGLKYDTENNKAYLQGWVSVLKNDPNALFRAAAQAEKVTDRVLGYEKLNSKSLGKEKTKEKTKEKSKSKQLSMAL